MENKFVFYCKTYRNDFDRFCNMTKNFNTFNKDNILMIVSVPESDLDLFAPLIDKNIKIISDESFAKQHLATETRYRFGIGYVNQEICKLCFWESNFAENYVCLDADSIFIRDFYINDFMKDKDTPYTVLVMDKDLSIEKYYRDFWKLRAEHIKRIFEFVGLDDKRYKTCHGSQCMSAKVLESLKKDFMESKNLEYKDLIEIAPYEFTWYNAWLQKTKIIDIVEVEPFFKTFHMRIEYEFSRLKLLKESDLAKAYVGIILNSNWTKKTSLNYENPKWYHKLIYKVLKKR